MIPLFTLLLLVFWYGNSLRFKICFLKKSNIKHLYMILDTTQKTVYYFNIYLKLSKNQ